MQVILVQVKPVFPGDGMSNGITGLRMQHHLGISHCARGEIDQAGIVTIRFGALKFGGCLIDDLVVARPALAFANISIGFD